MGRLDWFENFLFFVEIGGFLLVLIFGMLRLLWEFGWDELNFVLVKLRVRYIEELKVFEKFRKILLYSFKFLFCDFILCFCKGKRKLDKKEK